MTQVKTNQLAEMISNEPKSLSLLAETLKPDKLVKVILSALDSLLGSDRDTYEGICYNTRTLDVGIKEELVKHKPYLIGLYKGSQTLKMCENAFKTGYTMDKWNVVNTFSLLDHQTLEMVKLAVSGDGRCYKHVLPEFRTEEVKELAVDSNSCSLSSIEKPHSKKLVEKAVRGWAKAIQWADCEDLEEMQILAIELNLQAMPDKPVSQRVIDKFKELCIKDNYFDENWCPKFNLAQEQLYAMYEARHEWIESFKIFKLLNEEYMKKAIKSNLVTGTLKFSADELLKINDTELLYLLLLNVGSKVTEKLFSVLPTDKIDYIVSKDGTFLKYVCEENQSEELCIKAIDNTVSALPYIKNWTPALKSRLTKLVK